MPKGYTPWNKGLTKEDDERIRKLGEHNSRLMKKLWQNPEYREEQLKKIGLNHKMDVPWNKGFQMWKDNPNHWARQKKKREQVSKQISKSKKGVSVPLERRKRISETVKKRHKDGVFAHIYTDELNQKRLKAMHRRPTKPEQIVINLLSQLGLTDFKYTGNGTRCVAGFFLVNDEKQKIIEVFGMYWHRNDDGRERVKAFAKKNFETLILWENKIICDQLEVIKKIKEFAM